MSFARVGRLACLFAASAGGAGWAPRAARADEAAAAPAAASRIAAIAVDGSVDAPGQIESLIAALVPTGSAFLAPAGDELGDEPGTTARLQRAMHVLGYGARIDVARTAAGTRLAVHLRAYDRLRQIFVAGNGRIRQDEIIRRITIRPGQALPPEGPERDERIERERQNILNFLRNEGYFDATVVIRLAAPARVPAPINMHVRIDRGVGYPIGPIDVKNNHALSSEEIRETFRHNNWLTLWTTPLPFKLSYLEDDRRKVADRYREIGYPAATIRSLFDPISSVDRARKQVRLGLDVYENKRVVLAFEGNRRFDADELEDLVTFYDRGSINNYEKDASAEAIAQHYRNHGFMFVRVTWRRETVAAETDRVIFLIEEGPSLKVRSVVMTGNHAEPSGDLEDYATVKVFPFLGFMGLGEGGYASLRQLSINEERLEGFYNARGYHGAKVRCLISPVPEGPFQRASDVKPRLADNEPRWHHARALHVRFEIDEGPLFSVTRIRFRLPPGQGLPIDEGILRASLRQNEGQPYQRDLVRADRDQIGRLLQDRGYPDASAEAIPTTTGTAVDIEWDIKLGQQVKVGWVFVRGNFLTRKRTLLQWIPLHPGSLLEASKLEHGQRNLALIQLLNNPNPISFPQAARAGDTVPMLVEVEERHDHWGVLRFGGGASTEQAKPGAGFPVGFYVTAGYEHRDLFGLGWTLQSRGQLGTSLREIRTDFLNQRLLETTFRLQVGASYRQQATLRLGDTQTGEVTVALARLVWPGVDVAFRYSLRNTTRTERLLRGPGPDENQDTVQPGTTVGAIGTSVEWQRLDNPLVPTRGFKLFGSVELAEPVFSLDRGGDRFIKTQLRSLAVVPLSRNWSLRHSARYDQGIIFGGRSVLPKVERFFLGGDTTVRGYELDLARKEAIRAPLGPGSYAVGYRPSGGSVRVIGNLEVMYHVTGPLYSGLFLDNGLLVDSFEGASPAMFRHGAGVSPIVARFPVGDLSFSWGWPLDPEPGDDRYGRFHVNVGLMF